MSIVNEDFYEYEESCFWKDPDNSSSGVLLSDRLEYYIKKTKLIFPYNPDNIRPASCYLTVGDKYYLDDEGIEISDNKPLVVEKNSFVYVRIEERLNLPFYLIGMFNLKVKQTYRGFLMGTGLQIDPGYKGYIYVPLFNFADSSRELKKGDSLISIQFIKTTNFGIADQSFKGISKAKEVYEKPIFGFNGLKCKTFNDGKEPTDWPFSDYIEEFKDKDANRKSAILQLENQITVIEGYKGELEKDLEKVENKLKITWGTVALFTLALMAWWTSIFISWSEEHSIFNKSLTALEGKDFIEKSKSIVSSLNNMETKINIHEGLLDKSNKITQENKAMFDKLNQKLNAMRNKLNSPSYPTKEDLNKLQKDIEIMQIKLDSLLSSKGKTKSN